MSEKQRESPLQDWRLPDGRGKAKAQLLFTVVSPYVNFLALSHPEMTADKNLFMKSFLVIIVKALFQADSN